MTAALSAAAQPFTPKEGPVVIARHLMQGLRVDNAEQAAGLVASFDLSAPAAADGVAAEVGGRHGDPGGWAGPVF